MDIIFWYFFNYCDDDDDDEVVLGLREAFVDRLLWSYGGNGTEYAIVLYSLCDGYDA